MSEFRELFEEVDKVNLPEVKEDDIKKLSPYVRKYLAKDFTGRRLEDAVDAVTKGILVNFPDFLTDKKDGLAYKLEDEERMEEFVFDVAAREGY